MLKHIFKKLFFNNTSCNENSTKTEVPKLTNCIGCGLCINCCPTNAIEVFKFRDTICEYCGVCKNICPNNAIYGNYKFISSQCTSCGYCKLFCPIPLIKREMPLPKTPVIVDKYNKCLNCKLCIEKCPNKAIFFNADKNKIEINSKKCKKCLTCLTYCPLNCIFSPEEYIHNSIIKIDLDSCIFCNECKYICPFNK